MNLAGLFSFVPIFVDMFVDIGAVSGVLGHLRSTYKTLPKYARKKVFGQKTKNKLTKCNGFNRYGPDFCSIVGPCEKCVFADLGICDACFVFSGFNPVASN